LNDIVTEVLVSINQTLGDFVSEGLTLINTGISSHELFSGSSNIVKFELFKLLFITKEFLELLLLGIAFVISVPELTTVAKSGKLNSEHKKILDFIGGSSSFILGFGSLFLNFSRSITYLRGMSST
jgi:hypothetical protein